MRARSGRGCVPRCAVRGGCPAKRFQQVRVSGGSGTGYIATSFLRSPVDYRLIASRSGATWRITAFIAGD